MVAVHALSVPPAPRAFRVFHGGRLLGYLGEDAGLFESAEGAWEPGPPGCRFRSLRPETERAVRELLYAATDFDARLDLLERAGLQLEPAATSVGLFAASSVIHRGIVPSSLAEPV